MSTLIGRAGSVCPVAPVGVWTGVGPVDADVPDADVPDDDVVEEPVGDALVDVVPLDDVVLDDGALDVLVPGDAAGLGEDAEVVDEPSGARPLYTGSPSG